MPKGKEAIRATSRRGVESGKLTPAERRSGRTAEPTICDHCGAIFVRRSWRRDHHLTAAQLEHAVWSECPACRQVRNEEYCGRILVRGSFALANDAKIRRRIKNVAAVGGTTQPERRIVSLERHGNELEVLTTSQKLAHRIVRELQKGFQGRATYAWSDDGSLYAVWKRD